MIFEQVIADIFVYSFVAGLGAVTTVFVALYRCVHKQGKRGLRQSQAILLMAKSIDNFTKINHAGSVSDLYEKAKITLSDEKGEL